MLLNSSRTNSSEFLSQHKLPHNSAKVRPPTTITQSGVPLNTAQHRPQQLGHTSRHTSTIKSNIYAADCPVGHSTSITKTETPRFKPLLVADWLISRHVCSDVQPAAIFATTNKRLIALASIAISSDVQFCSLVYFFRFNNNNSRWSIIICKF